MGNFDTGQFCPQILALPLLKQVHLSQQLPCPVLLFPHPHRLHVRFNQGRAGKLLSTDPVPSCKSHLSCPAACSSHGTQASYRLFLTMLMPFHLQDAHPALSLSFSLSCLPTAPIPDSETPFSASPCSPAQEAGPGVGT